ncbi:hypothetical protein DAETH_47460 (plasmid) [Deinococcus aetherius]|uniref:Uncharacterized protein n=1 Tax=Deinococcus aetherius TaxID=200252 RepID=A0ABM8ALQ1_9DEIO|nr:hypothetical protein [Deinococcus aetherius]BDP44777.1 hypothetical protein DAETH_47460 [Deinococcus aetherius]
MDEQKIITRYLQEYGLLGVYIDHTPHGDYPLLHLRGRLDLDLLTLTPHLGRAAAQTGTLAGLWAGEQVGVHTAHPGALEIETSHPELANLMRQHVTNAAQDIQRAFRLGDLLEGPDHGLESLTLLAEHPEWEEPLDLSPQLATRAPREGGPQSLSRDERLDRARALRGQTVMDTFDVRALRQAEAEQERVLLHFPPPRDSEQDPEPRLSDEDVQALARQERLLRVEGAAGPGDRLEDDLHF